VNDPLPGVAVGHDARQHGSLDTRRFYCTALVTCSRRWQPKLRRESRPVMARHWARVASKGLRAAQLDGDARLALTGSEHGAGVIGW